jgi:outer membrane receptor protein involved in Fe transport
MIPTFLNPGSRKFMMNLKKVFLYVAFFFTLHLQGQISLQNDTILIKEVEIRGKTYDKDCTGYKTSHIDSSIIGIYNQRTLADLIAENSIIHLKTYGSGGLATISLRGTGPGHTQITWNEINLNNPMVGQFDLSLIPAGFIDDINIYYGGGSMNINGGGFGGVINLETKPEWGNQDLFLINPGIGSFGKRSGLAKVKIGTKSFQSVTKAFLGNSDNNFRYLNSVAGNSPVWETRENCEVRQKGFIQEFYFRNSHSNLSARMWYQSASRNLPVPIISPTMNPPEKQSDESVRAILTFESVRALIETHFTAAFISDKLDYSNELASIDSRNMSKRIILKSILEHRINKKLKLKFALNDEFNFIVTNNYNGNKSRNLGSVDVIAETDLTQWLAASVLARQMVQDHRLLSPDFSASAQIKPFMKKYYFIKASFSKNSKIPTLNDMYWSPGGNPDLKNETGYSSEITWEMTSVVFGSLWIKNDFTFYRNHISDMIQWHPGESYYWEPGNIGNIVTSGLESSLDVNYAIPGFNVRLNAGYAFTKASIAGAGIENQELSGNQLVYIPRNQFNTILRISWQYFYSAFTSSYTGKRFLTADNSQYLPQYSVSDLTLGTKFEARKISCDLGFMVENLFNSSYQNIAYYPMPGRSFLLSIVFQFKK